MTYSRSDIIIATQGLRKRYGRVVAIDDLDLEVPRAAVGLLGANGAGKSTLIKLLLGLHRPTAGSASVFGLDTRTMSIKVRERVGYMPESDCLPGEVTAADFVAHMAEVSGLPPRAARLRAAETLYHCGVDEERYRKLREFSTGMKQRVKLAQAIVHDPDLVFLDEPTNGMDPAGREEMLALIGRIHRQLGIAVVLSSHVLEDVEQTCDYVVMIDRGALVAAGPLSTLVQAGGDLLLEVDGDQVAMVERLRLAGLPVQTRGAEIVVHLTDEAMLDMIRDVAADLGIGIRALRPARRSLEDVFVQEVGGHAEAGASHVDVG